MDQALLSLLEEKEFAYITVKEICKRAGVNRSTFYLHYETVGDLLEESVEYMSNLFYEQFAGIDDVREKIVSGGKEDLHLATPAYLRPYLLFVQEHKRLYQTILKYPLLFQNDKRYQGLFEQIFDPILERFSVPQNERKYRMMFYLSGINAIVEQWLSEDCKDSIDEVVDIIQRCVLPLGYLKTVCSQERIGVFFIVPPFPQG